MCDCDILGELIQTGPFKFIYLLWNIVSMVNFSSDEV